MDQPAPLVITVTLEDRQRHYIDVSLELHREGEQGDLDLQMAAWTPGSYLIRNFARHVEDFRARAGSVPLPWRKADRETWRVEAGGHQVVQVDYRVYAFDESVRGALLDDRVGVWNGACVYMRPPGQEERPIRLVVRLPEDWSGVQTALSPVPGVRMTFEARDWDELLDCPVMAGQLKVHEFTAADRPHVLAMDGESTARSDRLVADLQRIVEAATTVFGVTPYERYLWLLHLSEQSWGGLEHLGCNYSTVPATAFSSDRTYRTRVLGVLSHEFFHLWNGKRLRPRELGPFDYQREVHTTMLWQMEGVTSYYDAYVLRRAGILSPDEYLEALGERVTSLGRVPGRLHDSVESASWDAWIKLYIPDENSLNRSVSYYLKGGVAMWLLDLDLRVRTRGQRGLEHVLQGLYRTYHDDLGRGLTSVEFRTACEEAAGGELAVHFEQHLGQPGELDLEPFLGRVGLRLQREVDRMGVPSGEEPGGHLGARLKESPGVGLVVEVVPRDGPAAAAGLSAGDEIVAADGFRTRTKDGLTRLLRGLAPGARLELTVARRGVLRFLPVVLGEPPEDRVKVVRVEDPTPEEQRLYEIWMHAPWPQEEDG